MAALAAEIFLLCDLASVSQENKLSIIGIFDRFNVADIPVNWPRMFLVATLSGEPQKEYTVKLKLIPPGSVQSDFPDKQLQLAMGPNGRSNLITELVNFPLKAVGLYKFAIVEGEKKIGELEFTVNKTTATYGQDLQGKKISN